MQPSAVPNLTHMGIYTDRPEQMRDFYMAALGLVVSDTGHGRFFPRRIIFMTGDPTQHHQFVLVVREDGDPPGGALFQVSFKVQTLDQLREVLRRAQALNATGLRRINHGNSWSVYFNDPDNNMIEIYMDTGWYIPQPWADILDLELSDEAIRDLTAERARTVPGALPQAEWSARIAAQLAASQAGSTR